jgi:hypothetical protein
LNQQSVVSGGVSFFCKLIGVETVADPGFHGFRKKHYGGSNDPSGTALRAFLNSTPVDSPAASSIFIRSIVIGLPHVRRL